MSVQVIDRRLNSRDKYISSRQKFMRRAKNQIREAIKDAIRDTSIENFDKEEIAVPIRDLDEPAFQNDRSTGTKQIVAPGNREYIEDDWIDKPRGGTIGRGKKASKDGSGEDDFLFILTHDEFMDLFFEDLELPDLQKKQLKDMSYFENKRAGYTNTGNPVNLDLVKTMRNSIGRRIGLSRPTDDDIQEIEDRLEAAKLAGEDTADIEQELESAKNRRVSVPWLDPLDVRYQAFQPHPVPVTSAVMFCVMDVSGSMGQQEKDIAKRFFILLNLLLKKKYENVEIVFIRHHSIAEETNEDDFFYKRESGGTVVSSAIELTLDIVKKRYPRQDYNIYIAQASDGDNWPGDSLPCKELLAELLPLVQYYAYLDIPNDSYNIVMGSTVLLDMFEEIESTATNLVTKRAYTPSDVWKVFRELFEKK